MENTIIKNQKNRELKTLQNDINFEKNSKSTSQKAKNKKVLTPDNLFDDIWNWENNPENDDFWK